MQSTEAKYSAFVETFGKSPLIKVLDFFLTYASFDYSKTQVAKETEISRITMEKVWKDLVRKGVIRKTREMGKAQMYKLNTEDPRVKVLMKLDFELSSAAFEQNKVPISVRARK